MNSTRNCPEPAGRRLARGDDLVGVERLAGDPGGGVGDQREPEDLEPAARAAIASSAVDMPTRSAPSVRSMRISAGVS